MKFTDLGDKGPEFKTQGVAEAEKNPHTSALGKALHRDLSKEKKASPAQVEKNKARWAQRQADKEQGVAEGSLEEVSQQTLQSYRKKASAQKRAADDVVSGDADDETWKKNVNLSAKRRQGIDAANKRLGVAEDEQRMSRAAKGVSESASDSKSTIAKLMAPAFVAGSGGNFSYELERKAPTMDALRTKYHDDLDAMFAGASEEELAQAAEELKAWLDPVEFKEEFNGEYDDEAGMAKSNLRTLARAVNGLLDTIGDDENLPEWAQEKIAKAEMMTTGVWDYLLSQEEQGIDPQVDEASLAQMRDYFNKSDNNTVAVDNEYGSPERKQPANVPPEIQNLINKMYRIGKITPQELDVLKRFQAKTGMNVGLKVKEAGNAYAIGMSQAMKSTGDTPPLKKSTINKAHKIARAIEKDE